MNEQEIVDYLKQNREKGVVYDFMPSDVRCWCSEHRDEFIFNFYSTGCGWHDKNKYSIDCNGSSVYCLPEDYEPEPPFKAHYEEFDIDKAGFFYVKKGSDLIYYHWFNWQKFIRENFDKYNNFGGWLFGDKLWSTNVLMTDIAERELYGSVAKDKTVVPVTPTKIKFWRYKE